MRGAVWVLLLLPALAGCLAGPASTGGTAAPADPTGYRLVNGTVWTADDARPRAEAVAVRGERIVAVGSDEEIRAADVGPRPRVVDLEGAMALPGFHDTHTHFVRVASEVAPEDPNPYEPWPSGYDPVMTRLEHQEVAAGHVTRWATAHAERATGDDTHPGGLQPAQGPALLDGTVAHADRLAINDLGPAAADDAERSDWKAVLRKGMDTAARYGLTSQVEAGVTPAAFDVLQDLDEEGDLTGRFHLYVFPEDLAAARDRGWVTGSGDDDVRFLGMKIYTDGWLGPRTAALREPYEDRPHRGFAFFTQEEMDTWVRRAHRSGIKVTAHTIGDRSTEMMLSAYEDALAKGCPPENASRPVCQDPRFTLEHTQLVPPDLMDRMVDVGLVPSIQLSFATSDAPWAEDAIGEERIEHAYPWRTMWEANLTVAGSSDFPIEVLPPLWGIERVVTRTDLDGEPTRWHPEEALTLEQALKSVTINAAYLEHREDELGSLTPGKYADVVVLEEDLFSVPPTEIADTDVWMTMVGGDVVYADPAMPDVAPTAPTGE